jgi:CheY-like chemotaxis protein
MQGWYRVHDSPTLRNTKLIALTGYSQEEHVSATRAAGIEHRSTKPVDVATSCCARHLAQRA